MKRPTQILVSLALVAGAASCGGGKPPVKSDIVFGAADSSNPEQWAFHKLGATDGVVQCTATIDSNPKATFGFNLTRDFDVVAVKLMVSHVADDGYRVTLSEATMQPVLFLENGTALAGVDPETIRSEISRKHVAAFDRHVFHGALLRESDTRAEGYLFFQLPTDPLDDEVEFVVAGADNSAYLVHLQRSLVRFTYDVDGKTRSTQKTINVGTK